MSGKRYDISGNRQSVIIRLFFVFALFILFTPGRAFAAAPKAKIKSPTDQSQFDLGKTLTIEVFPDTSVMSGLTQSNKYIYLRILRDGSVVYTDSVKWTKPSLGLGATTESFSYLPDREGEYRIEACWFVSQNGSVLAPEDFQAEDGITVYVIRDLSKSEVEITGVTDQTYNGTAYTPEPVVKLGAKTLNPDTDYTLSYSNNVDVGEATVTVTGKGFYKNSVSKTFQIAPANLSGASVSGVTDQFFTGDAIVPAISLSLGGKTLILETDYTVTCDNNTHVGTATVHITGNGNYTGSITKTFRIQQVSLVNAGITGISDQLYTGNPITQNPTITYAGKTLVKDTDYTLSYRNNTALGTATVVITGKGDFKDTVTRTFSIKETPVSTSSVLQIRDSNSAVCTDFNVGDVVRVCEYTNVYVFNNGEKDPYYYYVRISKDGQKLGFREFQITSPGVYILWEFEPLQAGDYLVEMSLSRYVPKTEAQFAANWNTVVHVGTGKTDISAGTVTGITNKEYTGNAITQNITVKLGGKTLVEGRDYYVTYTLNVNVGRAAMIIYGIGDYKGKIDQGTTFLITAKTITQNMITLSPAGFTYNGENQKPQVSVRNGNFLLTEGTDYTLTNEGGTAPGNYSVTVAAKNGGNYTGSASKGYNIGKLSLTGAEVAAAPASYTYDGTEKRPSVTVTMNGTVVPESAYDVTYSGNINAGKATVKVTAKADSVYSGSVSAVFTIGKYNLNSSDISVTPPADVTFNRKAQTPVPAVTWGSRTLEAGADYTLNYTANTDAGIAGVTITGAGNFTGTRAVSFRILRKDIADATVHVDEVPDQPLIEGERCEPKITVRDGSETLSDEDYSVLYADNDREGTASVQITGIGNYTGTITGVTFRILGRTVYDRNQLEAAVSEAEGADSEYLEADQAAVQAALDAAKDVLENTEATAEELEAALEELNRAVDTAEQNLADYLAQKEAEERAAEAARKEAEKAAAEAKKKADKAAAGEVVQKVAGIPAAGSISLADKDIIQAAEKAYNALTAEQKKLVPAETVKKLEEAKKVLAEIEAEAGAEEKAGHTTAAEAAKALAALSDNADPAGSDFATLSLKVKKVSKTSLKLQWKTVKGAAGYILYANKCGKGNKYQQVAELPGASQKKYTLKKIQSGALKKNTYYKVIVTAYKLTKGGEKRIIATSKSVHTATSGGKNGNPTKISVKKSVTVKVKKTVKLKAKQITSSGKKIRKHRKLQYETSDPTIATVSKKGVIKGKKKGKCTVYVYAQNGVYAKVKVTVKQ